MIKGIVKRWVLYYLSVTLLCLVALFFAAVFAVRTYYYDGVRRHLREFGESAVQSYAQSDEKQLWVNTYVGDFAPKESIDVAAADAGGSIVCISRGASFEAIDGGLLKESPDPKAYRTENLASGERVMLYGVPIYDDGGFVTTLWFCEPLQDTENKVLVAIIIVGLIGLLIVAATFVPGLLFMRTIVKPVRELRATILKHASIRCTTTRSASLPNRSIKWQRRYRRRTS